MENRDPLKAYNTTAYQPGKDDLAAVGSANFATNNFTENPTTTTQTPSRTRVEALQSLSTPQPDNISTLNQKPLESAENGPRTQNPPNLPYSSGPQFAQAFHSDSAASGLQNPQKQPNPALQKHKTRAKTITVIAILATALVLGIGVAVAWLIIDGSSQAANRPSTPSGTTPEAQVEELAIDDELVQRLYGQFELAGVGYRTFYHSELNDNPDATLIERGRLEVAMDNAGLSDCKATLENGGLQARYSGDLASNWDERQLQEVTRCYDAEKVREEYLEIFGAQPDAFVGEDYFLPDNPGVNISTAWAGFTVVYSPTYDEFYNTMGGAGAPATRVRKLIAAERDAEHVYLHEMYAVLGCGPYENGNGTFVEKCIGSDEYGYKYEWDFSGGERPSDEEVFEALKQLGTRPLKWTFTKTADGNYIFTSLEKTE